MKGHIKIGWFIIISTIIILFIFQLFTLKEVYEHEKSLLSHTIEDVLKADISHLNVLCRKGGVPVMLFPKTKFIITSVIQIRLFRSMPMLIWIPLTGSSAMISVIPENGNRILQPGYSIHTLPVKICMHYLTD